MKLFLDTNVLIDFIMERLPFYPAAATIVSYAVEGMVAISTSSMSVVTAKFICVDRCKMPLDLFRKKIDFLRDHLEVCSVNADDVYHAYDAQWKDFEDGVQYYAALRCGVDGIVTRNVKDFEEEERQVLSPDEACGILQATHRSEPTTNR